MFGRTNPISEQQSPVKRVLDDVRRNSLQLSNKNAQRFEQLETQIMETLKFLGKLDESIESHSRPQQRTEESLMQLKERFDSLQQLEASRAQECDRRLEELALATQHLSSLTKCMPMENKVLRRLFFPSIFQREHDVVDPSTNTFCWVFKNQQELQLNEPLRTLRSIESSPIQNASNESTCRHLLSESLKRFLDQDEGTMLLTGKAGCGKSTFMKYIAQHPTTMARLEHWAGGTKLVLVKVFFWQSDDAFQSSMVGFWQSVLFQILSQCPELITKVFPQQQTELDGIVDAMEFRAPELELAFQTFLDHSSHTNYSFCCFIDGLDEHQGDNLSHKTMATLLSSWASQGYVKIICSSRPYTVFLDIFRNTGTITEFHNLNFSDIRTFAEEKFISSLSAPQMHLARHNCVALAQEIATRAEGVFLWATMAVRALINQALDHDDSERALKQRLQECPDNLEALFQQMLSKIDRAPFIQKRSNMALYLAVHNPFEQPLNALIFSWLDELDWFQGSKSTQPSLHLTMDVEVYTQEVMISKKKKVDSLLHQITQGLLEVISVPGETAHLRYRVDLFHRSVRDFLRDQWQLGIRTSPFSNDLEQVQAYCHLRCIELEVLIRQKSLLPAQPLQYDNQSRQAWALYLTSIFENTFLWLAACSKSNNHPPISCLQNLETTLYQAENTSSVSKFTLGLLLINSQTSWRWHTREAVNACSFVHWAAYWSQGHFVKSNQEVKNSDLKPSKEPADLSLLLSSSLAADVDTTKYLLSNSELPSDTILISEHHPDYEHTEIAYGIMTKSSSAETISAALTWDLKFWEGARYQKSNNCRTSASVWMVFLRDFASNVRSYCWKRRNSGSWPMHLDRDWLDRLAHIIEAYLRAGSDPEVFFLLCIGDSAKPFRVDMYQMLDIFKPDNLSSLGELLARRPWWKSYWARGFWKSPSTDMYEKVTTSTLVNDDWGVLGIRSENGEALMGSFKVRVF